MKTKNRLLLSSALLLGLVAVSGTTATYAWFTVGMSQDATVSNITASAGSDLKVVFTNPNDAITITDGTKLEWNSAAGLTDITSNADLTVWNKAKFDSTGEQVKSLKDVTASISAAYATNVYYAATFSATVSFGEGAVDPNAKFNVYLSGDETNGMISGVDSVTNIVKATRVYVANENESLKVVYLGKGSSSNITTGTEGSIVNDTSYGSGVKIVKADAVVEGATKDNTAIRDGSVQEQLVGVMQKSNTFTVNLKFTIFIEGTDSVNEILDNKEKANLNFHFYAIEQ